MSKFKEETKKASSSKCKLVFIKVPLNFKNMIIIISVLIWFLLCVYTDFRITLGDLEHELIIKK